MTPTQRQQYLEEVIGNLRTELEISHATNEKCVSERIRLTQLLTEKELAIQSALRALNSHAEHGQH